MPVLREHMDAVTDRSTFSVVDFVLSHSVFNGCNRQSLSRLVPHLIEKKLAPGETLYVADAPAGEIFLIVEGTLQITAAEGKEISLGEGLLGDEAIAGLKEYSGSAVAKSNSRVLVIPLTPFQAFLKVNPFLKDKLVQRFAIRNFSKSLPIAAAAETSPATPSQKSSGLPVFGWLLATVFPLCIVYFLQNDPAIPNRQALYLIAVIGCVAIMWMFQLLPDFIPALFAVLIIILLGLAPTETVLSGFASNSFFMALSILGLGTVLTTSGLGYRILLLLLKAGPANTWWNNMCVFLMGLILNPLVPTANGRIAIVSPFVQELLRFHDGKTAKREAGRLTVSALAGAGLFSAVFLSSKSINFIIYGSLPSQEQAQFQWLYWLYAASVCGLVMMVLFQVSFALVFRSSGSSTVLTKQAVRDQITVLGPMDRSEWAAVIGFCVLAISFTTNSLHRIEIPWVALSIFYGLLMFGFIDKEKFRKHIDWSFLVFLAALIGLVASMKHTGVDLWLTSKFDWLNAIMASNFPLFILMLAGAISAVRIVLPINATVVIFAALLLPTAVNIGVNPWLVGFLILFLSESFVLPYQASYYAQYCALTGVGQPAHDRRLVPYHLALAAMKLIAVYASMPFWKYLGLL